MAADKLRMSDGGTKTARMCLAARRHVPSSLCNPFLVRCIWLWITVTAQCATSSDPSQGRVTGRQTDVKVVNVWVVKC